MRTKTVATLATIALTGTVTISLALSGGAGAQAGHVDDENDTPMGQAAPSTGSGAETSTTVSDEAEYRAALNALSADNSGPHTITLEADIVLDDGGDPTYSGTQALTINGAGFGIDAGGTSRILFQNTTAALTVTNITMANGSTPNAGGAINNDGDLTVNGATFTGNEADGDGGAVDSEGITSIVDSTFTDNSAGSDGGAVDMSTGGVTIDGSTFSGNTNDNEGAAVSTEIGMVIINSTVTGNDGAFSIVQTYSGDVDLVFDTVADNVVADDSGSIEGNGVASLLARGLVVEEAGDDCGGFVSTTDVAAYDTDGTCGFQDVSSISGGPPTGLAPLADNGGPTQTMLPDAGGPLVDAVDPAVCQPFVDQRDVTRPQDGLPGGNAGCDFGAVEVEPFVEPPPPPPPPPVDPEPDPGPISGSPPFTG
jgi:hypothetical protein